MSHVELLMRPEVQQQHFINYDPSPEAKNGLRPVKSQDFLDRQMKEVQQKKRLRQPLENHIFGLSRLVGYTAVFYNGVVGFV